MESIRPQGNQWEGIYRVRALACDKAPRDTVSGCFTGSSEHEGGVRSNNNYPPPNKKRTHRSDNLQ